uniref:Putative secreted protein n=1 Tax=Amblyomma aureolatum TaxID=187763 RepID=A0A1E1X059_9ACAR
MSKIFALLLVLTIATSVILAKPKDMGPSGFVDTALKARSNPDLEYDDEDSTDPATNDSGPAVTARPHLRNTTGPSDFETIPSMY